MLGGVKSIPPIPIEALSQSLLVCISNVFIKVSPFFLYNKILLKKCLIIRYMIWFMLLIK